MGHSKRYLEYVVFWGRSGRYILSHRPHKSALSPVRLSLKCRERLWMEPEDTQTSPTANSHQGSRDLSSISAVKRIWPVPKPINSETDSVPEFLGTLQSAQLRERVS